MSADNGIYIAHFPTASGGVEYRVAEFAAVDNLSLSWVKDADYRRVLEDAYRRMCYNRSEVYSNLDDAYKKAREINQEISKGGWFTEYGICELKFDRPFPDLSREKAAEIIENW